MSRYSGEALLTQSCDLVRRGTTNKCSSRYITLAAVRSLDTVLKRSIEQEANKRIQLEQGIFCSDAHKNRLITVLESLLNNNAKEYFFLKAFPEKGLNEDSCTFLHLSIAIKAHEDYDLCLKAKRLELNENFQSKLGWLVGNLYSRVGTEDYASGAKLDESSFRELIITTLEKNLGWIPNVAFQEFKNEAKSGLTFDEIYQKAKTAIETKKINKIQNLVNSLQLPCDLNSNQINSIKEFLASKKGFQLIRAISEP